ncbi:MAG: hypothetical protein GY856_47950, partial [bacterium]|nr:hypothetical protein [bacterium]
MKILALGTSGLDLLARPLKQAMAPRSTSEPEIVIGAYGQWQASLLRSSTDSEPDLVLVVLDADDLLAPHLDQGPDRIAGVAAELPEFTVAAIERGLDTNTASHLVVTTLVPPTGHMLGSLADNLLPGLDVLVEEFNRTLRRWAAGEPRVHLLGLHRLLLEHGRATMRDPRLWAHARCRWSRDGLRHLAEEVASVWDAIHGQARKCLVLDLDNTLWGGIAGDDGMTGIELGHEGIGLAYRELQQRL